MYFWLVHFFRRVESCLWNVEWMIGKGFNQHRGGILVRNVLILDWTNYHIVVKWESPAGEVGQEGEEGFFPHLYNGLKVGKDEVEAVGEWKKGAGQWSREGWPFREEDVPQ